MSSLYELTSTLFVQVDGGFNQPEVVAALYRVKAVALRLQHEQVVLQQLHFPAEAHAGLQGLQQLREPVQLLVHVVLAGARRLLDDVLERAPHAVLSRETAELEDRLELLDQQVEL